MNKRDIIKKLQFDKEAIEALIRSKFASDSKIKLEAQLQYVNTLMEYIVMEAKV